MLRLRQVGISLGLVSFFVSAFCRADIVGEHWDPAKRADYRAWASDDAWSTEPPADNFPFKPQEAATRNHGRPIPDAVIKSPSGRITVRASTAFAGAISSIRYDGNELVHGTIGAAFQLHLRYSQVGMYDGEQSLLNECENPTEAGNQQDGVTLPAQGPSSSYLDSMGVDSEDGLQRIVTRNAPVDFVPPGSRSDHDYGHGFCRNDRREWFSGYYLTKWVTAGWKSPLSNQIWDNVIRIDSRVDVPQDHQDMKLLQAEIIGYFRRWAWSQETYSSSEGGVFLSSGNGLAAGGGEMGNTKVFFNIDRSFGVAVLPFHNRASEARIARNSERAPITLAHDEQPSVYSQKLVRCIGAVCAKRIPYSARTLQSDFHFTRPGPSVSLHAFVVMGSPAEIKSAIDSIVAYARSPRSPYFTKEIPDSAGRGRAVSRPTGEVTGKITAAWYDAASGSFRVRGWACQQNVEKSLGMHLYLGGDAYFGGQKITEFSASQYAVPEANAACRSGAALHGFDFAIGHDTLAWHPKQPLYLHAISTSPGRRNWAIAGSGTTLLPDVAVGGALNRMWFDGASGGVGLEGWACASAYRGSLDVHVYLGGVYLAGVRADVAHGSAAYANCGTAGVAHGYRVIIPKYFVMRHAGLPITLYALHPTGRAHLHRRLYNDGYGLPAYYRPLYSYWNHRNHLVHSDDYQAARLGYWREGQIGWVLNTGEFAGGRRLYSCWVSAWNRQFPTSSWQECAANGGDAADLGGLAAIGATGGTTPLWRCAGPSDHMTRAGDGNPCGSYAMENLVGHLPNEF